MGAGHRVEPSTPAPGGLRLRGAGAQPRLANATGQRCESAAQSLGDSASAQLADCAASLAGTADCLSCPPRAFRFAARLAAPTSAWC